jgi:hypothetical protein
VGEGKGDRQETDLDQANVLQRVATSGYVDVGQGVGVGVVLLYSEWEFAKQAFQTWYRIAHAIGPARKRTPAVRRSMYCVCM